MFYTFKDCRLLLNGNSMFASTATLSLEANTSPLFLAGNSSVERYAANQGLVGSLRLTYFMTGFDIVKSYLMGNEIMVTGNIGGLYFNSGCVRSYSFSAVPNAPVLINAEIAFYDELSGSFSPTRAVMPDVMPLNFANASFDGASIGNLSSITNVSFSASNDIQASWRVIGETENKIVPKRIYFGQKQATVDIGLDMVSGNLPVSGLAASFTLYLADGLNVIRDVFTIDGIVTRKELVAPTLGMLAANISIHQDNFVTPPNISGFAPKTIVNGGGTLISGDLGQVAQVFCGNSPAYTFFQPTPTRVNAFFENIRPGKIRIISKNGTAISTGTLTIVGGIGFF